jgi:CHAD domain-containing protein
MKPADKPVTAEVSLGTVAHAIIGSTFQRADRFREAILHADPKRLDPEDIHQMRVSLRQLRSALQLFRPHLRLPKAAQEPVVKALAQCLGAVRDLDILQDHLTTHYLPALPPAEQRHLQKMMRQWERQRTRSLDTLYHRLQSDRYRHFQKAYRTWLKSPRFSTVPSAYATNPAQLSFVFLAPDIVLTRLSQWLQHPGWFVATIAEGGLYTPTPELNLADLRAQEPEFHALRKCMKQLRYQLTLLSPFLGETTAARLTAIVTPLKEFQDILGHLQDLAIIRKLVEAFLQAKGLSPDRLQTALQRLDQDYLALWQHWQPIQAQYLSPAFRFELRQQVAGLGLEVGTLEVASLEVRSLEI